METPLPASTTIAALENLSARITTKAGWDADLVLERAPVTEPKRDQVLIEVEACGVCHRDLIDRDGRFPWMRCPVTPGHEACGRVIAVGPTCTEWKVGDRVATMHRDSCGTCERCREGEVSMCAKAMWVFGLLADGAYARYLLAPQLSLFRVPEDIPGPAAAVLHCTFGTAYRGMVGFGRLAAGQRALITGANGGVGAAAVQLASRLGAEVVATVRDASHEAFVRELGADEVLVDTGASFHRALRSKKVDVALECVGQPTFNASLRSLRMGGRMVVVGNVGPTPAELNLGYIIVNGIKLAGSSGATREDVKAVLAIWDEAPFVVPIDRCVPLEEADAAQRLVRAGGLRGRIVLVPSAPRA